MVTMTRTTAWTHGDLLRLSHPKPDSAIRHNLYRYVVDTMTGRDPDRIERMGPHRRDYQVFPAGEKPPLLPPLVTAYEQVQTADVNTAVQLIAANDLSWEMLPDRLVTEPAIWEVLIDKGLPQTALLRQLPRLTRLGLTTGHTGQVITDQLTNTDKLRQGRIHPINVLVAQKTYAQGRSTQGSSTWVPTPQVTDALDAAFYGAYGAVEPSGKRRLLALDVSGSMGSPVSGLPISCTEYSGPVRNSCTSTPRLGKSARSRSRASSSAFSLATTESLVMPWLLSPWFGLSSAGKTDGSVAP